MLSLLRSRLNLDGGGGGRNLSIPLFQTDEDFVGAGPPEDVFDGETSFDFGFPGLVRRAVAGRFRARVVAPFPFDGWAVVLLEIVSAADELRRQHDPRRGDA